MHGVNGNGRTNDDMDGEKGVYVECEDCSKLFLQRNFERLCRECDDKRKNEKGIAR